MILHGDSLEILKTLDDNSIDSVVTDPPYGLSFMGKSWDYDVPQVELWQEVFRVLKPGGHLLSFVGSRTYHRMAVNIEDAGFEIRDQIMWVYGSGFPKSLNISKALDKMVSDTPGSPSEKTNNVVGLNGTKDQPSSWDNNEYGGGNARCPECGKWYISGSPCKCPKPEIAYKTDEAKQWSGWGTALKPSHEPIVVARKPISEKNIAENVLKWGTGGINIDGCRIGTEQRVNKGMSKNKPEGAGTFRDDNWQPKDVENIATGRFPANFIHDGSDEVVELLGDAHRFFYCAKASKSERNKGLEGFEEKHPSTVTGRKIGSAGAQNGGYAGMTETPRANIHPTVKPVKLMQYLVRLVTPKGGTVLDPFNGSGTTGIACKLEGFDYIGIEREAEYVEISRARIEAWETDKQMELIDV